MSTLAGIRAYVAKISVLLENPNLSASDHEDLNDEIHSCVQAAMFLDDE